MFSEKILSSRIFLIFEHHLAVIPLHGNLRNICIFSEFKNTQQLGGKLPRNNPVLQEVGQGWSLDVSKPLAAS